MDTSIAFIRSDTDRAVRIVVNFGPLTGREATLAEVDRLARQLLATTSDVRVHAIRSHDMGHECESVVHQVIVEADTATSQAESLRQICESWASDCAAERSLAPLNV